MHEPSTRTSISLSASSGIASKTRAASRFRLLAAALLLCFAATTARAGQDRWTPLGLEGGYVTSMAAAPDGTILAGTRGGGLFRSTDSGETWDESGTGLLSANIRAIAVAPTVPDRLLAASASGIHRSEDGGFSWQDAVTGLPPLRRPASAVVFGPGPGTTAWAAFDFDGVYRTDDGGATWVLRTTGLPDVHGHFALAYLPEAGGVLFTTGGSQVYRSLDDGESWVLASDGLSESFRPHHLAIDPSRPGTAWVAGLDFSSDAGLYRTSDFGITWTDPSDAANGNWISALFVDPATGDVYAQGSEGLSRSQDAGATWMRIGNGLDANALESLLVRDTVVLAGVRHSERYGYAPGIFRSADAGTTWQITTAGLTDAPSSSAVTVPGRPEHLLAATESRRAHLSADQGSSWSPPPGLEEAGILRTHVDPTEPDTVWAFTEDASAGLYRSRDGGETWTTSPSLEGGTRDLAVDPFSDAVYAVGGAMLMSRSLDGGDTWTELPFPSRFRPLSIAADPSRPDVLFAGSYYDPPITPPLVSPVIYRSQDGGETWETVYEFGQSFAFLGGVLDFAFDPSSPDRMVAAVGPFINSGGGGLLLSRDGGRTWPETRLLGVDVMDLLVDPSRDGTLYAASDNAGVFVSDDAGETWTSLSNGLGPASIRDLSVDPGHPETLYAATGSGLWTFTRTASDCRTSETTLCLLNRFSARVSVGSAGTPPLRPGQARDIEREGTPIAGLFHFGNPANPELVLKMIDGRSANGHFWLFWGAMTDQGYELEVVDTLTGATRTYSGPAGRLASGADTRAFGQRPGGATGEPLLRGGPAAIGSTSLNVGSEGRFEVRASWSSGSHSGEARGALLSTRGGYFTFFREDNVELVFKVLDGRAVNGHFWVFASALSNVEWTLTVTDTETGEARVYDSASGELTSLADTRAF